MKKVIFIIIIMCCGCWNYKELNNYAIVNGMAVDYENNQYKISFLIANGKKIDNTETEIGVLTGTGDTIYEAIEEIELISPKELYISQLSLVVLSEDLMKNGINEILDFLLRDPELYQNFYIIASKDASALDTISVLSNIANYPAQNISDILFTAREVQGMVINPTFSYFIKNYIEDGKDSVINSITIIGNTESGINKEDQNKTIADAYTKLDTIGILKNNKFASWTTKEENMGVSFIIGDISSFYINTPCNGSYAVTIGDNYNVDYKVEKNKIIINSTASGYLSELGCNIDLTNEAEIENLENETVKIMKLYMNLAIDKAKSLNADIFGFGNMIYKKYPKYFNAIDNWDENYKNLVVEINAKFKYTGKGDIEQSLEGVLK